mgnify:CR=1 FL=1
MATNVRVEVLVGTEIEDWLDRVAQLRIEIFSSYPYLYEGDMDYERHYLRNYATVSYTHLTLPTILLV